MADAGSLDRVRVDGAPNKAAGKAKKRLTGLPLLVVALGVALLVQALFVTSYVGGLHSPKPRDVAFGVTGSSPVTSAVGKQLSLKGRAAESHLRPRFQRS
jgi:hypothetical protein